MITWEKCKPEFQGVAEEEVDQAINAVRDGCGWDDFPKFSSIEEMEAVIKATAGGEVSERSQKIFIEIARLVYCNLDKIFIQADNGIKKVTLNIDDAQNPLEQKAMFIVFVMCTSRKHH